MEIEEKRLFYACEVQTMKSMRLTECQRLVEHCRLPEKKRLIDVDEGMTLAISCSHFDEWVLLPFIQG